MSQVRIKFNVIRPDGLDRETKAQDGEENNALIRMLVDWEASSNIVVGEFSLAECRLILGSGSEFDALKAQCETPSVDMPVIDKLILFTDFVAWIKTYKNNNALTFFYENAE